MLKQDETLPEIYTDPAFAQSSHWELSTSQLSSRYLDGWGYGEGQYNFSLSLSLFLKKQLILRSGT
jgi:Choline/Carnitine o-acyltransferase